MIRFGAWSTLLALPAAFGVTVGLLLWNSRRNSQANRLLAALIFTLSLKLGPYILGFAGFYDAYPRLSFAPFDLGLAVGPLVWMYLRRLTSGALPTAWWRHLLPAAVQLLYGMVLLPMPQGQKDHWNDQVHAPWIDPTETALEACSMGFYFLLAWRQSLGYQRWLDDHVSNREELRLIWVRNFVIALLVMLALWAPYQGFVLLAHLNYYQRFPLYIGLGLLVFYLGLEGWRHAADNYPLALSQPPRGVTATSEPDEIAQPVSEASNNSPSRDWHADGARWKAQMATAQWWRDPDLSLERLAKLLGTNTGYLSRALNEGLGLSFNETVNQERVAEIQRCLMDPSESRDFLQLALDAGFSSKTSFNRVFKAQTGQTPTQYRQGQIVRSARS